ncbi:MAG: response regulator [Candidatus Heimdallarchaeota archaeon]
MKILVVDDDAVFLDKMKKNLSIDRHSVTTALSGEEALETLRETAFDLVITDLRMNELSGIDLIKKMNETGIDANVIVLTGYGTINSAVEAMKYGAYDYLLKPLRLPTLRNKISEVGKELQFRNELAVPEVTHELDRSETSIPDLTPPFLIVSTRNPDDVINSFSLTDASTVHVSYIEGQGKIAPSKLHLIRDSIRDFAKQQEKGTIIFDGIQDLLMTHRWKNLKKFIRYLQEEIISSDYTMLFLIDEGSPDNGYDKILLHDALSILSVQTFDIILDIISHSIRKNIITLLTTRGPTRFNKIAEELEIENTATLTFHIKKLVRESVLMKEDNSYALTARGEFLNDIIFDVEKAGVADPGSRVKVVKFQRNHNNN